MSDKTDDLKAQLIAAADCENTGGVSTREFEANPEKYPEIKREFERVVLEFSIPEMFKSTLDSVAFGMRAIRWIDQIGLDGVGELIVSGAADPQIKAAACMLSEEIGADADDQAVAEAVEELRRFAVERFADPEARMGRVVRLLVNLNALEEPEGIYYRYVDKVLREEDGDVDDEYRDRLARALFNAVDRLLDHIANYAPEPDGEDVILSFAQLEERNGMLWLDAVAIDWLEAEESSELTNPEGAREKARERWRNDQGRAELLTLWTDPDEPIPSWELQPVALVCKHLWETGLQEKWKRSRDSFPAVTQGVYDNIERVSLRPDRVAESDQERRQMRLFEAGELVASTSTLPLDSYERLEAVISEGTDELRTMTAIRFMTQLIRECHNRWVSGEQSPTIFVWNGWTELADWTGATSKRELDRLPRILEAGARWEVQWENSAAIGLWTATTARGEPGPKGGHVPDIIQVRVGEPLAPLWTFKGKHRSVLMPVVELPELDTETKRWMPAQAAFALAVVRELVERRDEIHQHGGAELTPATVERVAARVGCPKSTAHRLMERWTDGSEAAFLDAVEPGRYHLANNDQYGKARRFLDDTARRSHRARRMGKASAKKRKGKPKKAK